MLQANTLKECCKPHYQSINLVAYHLFHSLRINGIQDLASHHFWRKSESFSQQFPPSGALASWLVRLCSERAVKVRALARDIVLCSWARHVSLTVPLSTQVDKSVPANLMLGVTLQWTSIPSRRSWNTPGRFMLRKPSYALVWWATWLIHSLHLLLCFCGKCTHRVVNSRSWKKWLFLLHRLGSKTSLSIQVRVTFILFVFKLWPGNRFQMYCTFRRHRQGNEACTRTS